MAANPIGEYLRARREQLRPDAVGITATGHRRVPGLRRDELAMLAGISTEYYTRLEQGRDRRPSTQVLDALAAALGLDSEATAHLHALAQPGPQRRRTRRRTETVRPSVLRLLASWTHTPAYIQGRYLDVLAANRLALALSPIFLPGTNLLRAALLDPAAEVLLAEPEPSLGAMIATLRATAGSDVDDPRLTDLVGELSVKSELFRTLWARHDVRPHPGSGVSHIRHPQVGELELQFDKFSVADAPDQRLLIYHAEPHSPSAEALSLLASLAADAPPDTGTPTTSDATR